MQLCLEGEQKLAQTIRFSNALARERLNAPLEAIAKRSLKRASKHYSARQYPYANTQTIQHNFMRL